MAIITLTTDLGLKDYYVSAIKGAILSQLPEATIVDISHEIVPFDILQASFIIKNAYLNFPVNTIHIIGVNAQLDMNTPYVAVYANGHYFIGADNGIFSLIFDKKPEMIVDINIKPDNDFLTFPSRDVFVRAACHIARGGTLEIIGVRKEQLLERTLFKPFKSADSIKGMAIYIDCYENVICNITREDFKEVGKGRAFSIYLRKNTIHQISRTYNEVADGELLAMFNSIGFLELSINRGKISSLLNLKLNDAININFDDH